MKTLTIKLILSLVFLVGLGACSSGGGGGDASSIADVTLTYTKSVSCSDANSFSIEPSAGNRPDITFSTNTTTGVTTITYNSTDGSATVVGCEQP